MDKLKEQLIRHEAIRYKPYDDATGKELKKGDMLQGKLTIGIGWNLSDVPLPEAIVDVLYEISITSVDKELHEHLPWVYILDDVRRDVMRNLCFNMGMSKLLEFKNTLASIQMASTTLVQSDWDTACEKLKNSLWYKQVGPRAVELVEQLRTGMRRS